MATDQANASVASKARSPFRAALWLVPVGLLALLLYVVISALHAAPRAAPAPPVVSGGAFPRQVVEANGRTVTIAAKPKHIVAADSGGADVLANLVEPERIAAVPALVNDFAGAVDFYRQHSEIRRFEKYDAEILLAIKPDLVLASSVHNQNTLKVLSEAGIPVMLFDTFRTFDGIRDWISCVGQAVGEERKAQALTRQFEQRLQAVEKAVAGRPRPRLLSYSNYGHGFAVGTGESQDEVMRRAGGVNAAAEMDLVGHVNFTFEQLLKLNPDYLVVAGDQGLDSPQVKVLLNEASIASLPAISQRRIAVVPDRYYAAISQHVVEAVEILARQIHTDAFVARPGGTAEAPRP